MHDNLQENSHDLQYGSELIPDHRFIDAQMSIHIGTTYF